MNVLIIYEMRARLCIYMCNFQRYRKDVEVHICVAVIRLHQRQQQKFNWDA